MEHRFSLGRLARTRSDGVASLQRPAGCNYCAYVRTRRLKVARIGNSRGVRLPAEVLKRYHIEDSVLLEEQVEGLLLRPDTAATPKLTWEETAREMSQQEEDWGEWDTLSADGLHHVPWDEALGVADPRTHDGSKAPPTKKK
jgi:antitoxin component of MazEF toxin-antitoxin module